MGCGGSKIKAQAAEQSAPAKAPENTTEPSNAPAPEKPAQTSTIESAPAEPAPAPAAEVVPVADPAPAPEPEPEPAAPAPASEPVSESVVDASPTADTVVADAASEAPAADAPPADDSPADATATDAPVADAPVTDSPAADVPATDAPAADAPAADTDASPSTDAPATDAPAADATAPTSEVSPAADPPAGVDAADAPAGAADDSMDAPAADAASAEAPAADKDTADAAPGSETAAPAPSVAVSSLDFCPKYGKFNAIEDLARFTPKHRSLMCKHLSAEVYSELREVATPSGWTIDQTIQCGVDLPHLIIGCTAGDEAAYDVFRKLFKPVIEEYHGYNLGRIHRVDLDASKIDDTISAEDKEKYIVSTRVRCGRNIRGLSLPPGSTRAERRKVESLLQTGLTKLEGDLAGKFYSLATMTDEERDQLIEDHFLFQKPGGGTLLAAAGAARDWPDARGIYHNDAKNFLVWCNEEDHMRIISMQKGGDIKEVFTRFCTAVTAVEDSIKGENYEFMFNKHLGFIATCPSNLGTALRASQFVKLPLLSADEKRFKDICNRLNLQPRGTSGEHTESVGGVYDVSNKHRLGYTEVELVQTMIDGIGKLIELEKKLEAGESIDDDVANLQPTVKPADESEAVGEPDLSCPTVERLQFTADEDLPKFTPAHRSLMAKHLTPDIYTQLSGEKTDSGWTIQKSIQCGIDLPHLIIGLTAGDEQSYTKFYPIFAPIISEYHGIDLSEMHKVDLDPDNITDTISAEDKEKYIISTRVRCGRNIRGLSLPPGSTRAERRKVEGLLEAGLASLEGELAGK
eukprot:Rmarinus@m.3392